MEHDIFISHASEDKAAVARPLSQALVDLGWRVWLDELELTIGDSLSGRIDAALARTRFGVVVLSPAFFGKAWPERELAGLAAREIGAGTKIILPVWHEVDHALITQRSPVLADRLGALTSSGIPNVAKELARTIDRASGPEPMDGSPPIQPAELPASKAEPTASGLIEIPSTRAAQKIVIDERPASWEYRLYAGVLLQGRIELEGKWLDHELKLPRGPRREANSDGTVAFLKSEMSWAIRKIENVQVAFEPELLQRAFGAPGEHGDPERIEHVARAILQMYESMMDWGASLRNTVVPPRYEELLELVARMVDGPLRQIREFIQAVADQVARVEILLEEATESDPNEVSFTLDLSPDGDLLKEIQEAALLALS